MRETADVFRMVKQRGKDLGQLWNLGGMPMALKVEKGKYDTKSNIEISVYYGTWVNTPRIARDYTLTVYSNPGM